VDWRLKLVDTMEEWEHSRVALSDTVQKDAPKFRKKIVDDFWESRKRWPSARRREGRGARTSTDRPCDRKQGTQDVEGHVGMLRIAAELDVGWPTGRCILSAEL
jgi:hypothetical protein